MKQRRYLQTLSELIDRLTIVQLKEVFIPEYKQEYALEIEDIVHDIQLILDETQAVITAETIRAIVVLAQMNLHIWHNESNYRRGIRDGNNLELTHGLNGIRNTSKNIIQELIGGRKDYKIDCLAADFKDWEISWPKREEDSTLPFEMNFVFDEWDNITNTPLPNRLKNRPLKYDENSHWRTSLETMPLFDNIIVRPRKMEDIAKNPNEKFYYHVWFRRSLSHEIFSLGKAPVDENVLEEVRRNKNFYLLIMNEQEPEPLQSFIELNSIAEKHNIPLEQIWLVSNNERLHEYKQSLNSSINVHNCRTIINIVRRGNTFSIDDWTEEKMGNFFLCHNRQPRIHRYALLTLLKHNSILDTDIDWSLINGWQFKNHTANQHRNNPFMQIFTFDDVIKYQKEIDFFTSIDLKKSSYELEYDSLERKIGQHVFSEPNTYKNAYFNIVTETNFLSEDIHITEKTFKPFFYFQFPIICGVHHHIKYFKNAYPELDFFDDVINHGYDNIKDNRDRLFAIVELIKQINNNKDFYKQFYKENKHRFIKNHLYIKNYFNLHDYKFFKRLAT